MNKKIVSIAIATVALLGAIAPSIALADEATSTATSTVSTTVSRTPGGYSVCVPTTVGYFCPTEQARQRMIDIIKAKIALLKSEIAQLLLK